MMRFFLKSVDERGPLSAAALVFVFTLTATAQTAPHAALTQNCAGCHNDKLKSGSLSLTALDLDNPAHNAKDWEKAILKIRSGMMPPAGAKRDAPAINSLANYLEQSIDRASAQSPNPGRPALHRLNRAEYANSVHDLLGIDIDPAAWLPADDMSHGFDNMAEVLTVSPTLMDGYVRAAGKISRLAVGDPGASPQEETYHLASTFSQTHHVEGTPLGTRGGIVFTHNFPADGDYTFRMTLYFTTNTLLFGTYEKNEQLEVAVNGEKVALIPVNPRMKVDDDMRTPPIHIKAGPQVITASFIQKTAAPVDDFVMPFEQSLEDLFAGQTMGLTALPHLRNIGVIGPYKVTGVSETPSRKKIFACRPTKQEEEIPCAKRILSNLAHRAYRRPITDADREDLLSIYQTGRNKNDFDSGIRMALEFILANPQFVFRFEHSPAGIMPGTNYRITDIELASRLSYFLWSSAPDEHLLTLAVANRLHELQTIGSGSSPHCWPIRAPDVALISNSHGQWLYLRNLKSAQSRTSLPTLILTTIFWTQCAAKPNCFLAASSAKIATSQTS